MISNALLCLALNAPPHFLHRFKLSKAHSKQLLQKLPRHLMGPTDPELIRWPHQMSCQLLQQLLAVPF